MSENVTLAKSRKAFTLKVEAGDYFILVQPGREFNIHLHAYREIAHKSPVHEDFERVVTGRLNYTSSALNLVTGKQDEERRKNQDAHLNRIVDAVNDAQVRQAKRIAAELEDKAEAHQTALDKKNGIVADLRKDTGQKVAIVPPIEKPKAAEPAAK